jgi:hypothetical protein
MKSSTLIFQIFSFVIFTLSLALMYSCVQYCERNFGLEKFPILIFALPLLVINGIIVLHYLFKGKLDQKSLLSFVTLETLAILGFWFFRNLIGDFGDIKYLFGFDYFWLFYIIPSFFVYLPFFTIWFYSNSQKNLVLFWCLLLQVLIFFATSFTINSGNEKSYTYYDNVKSAYVNDCKKNTQEVKNYFEPKKYPTFDNKYIFELELSNTTGCSLTYSLTARDKDQNKSLFVQNHIVIIANPQPFDPFDKSPLDQNQIPEIKWGQTVINKDQIDSIDKKMTRLAKDVEINTENEFEVIRYNNVVNLITQQNAPFKTQNEDDKFDIGCAVENDPRSRVYDSSGQNSFVTIYEYKRPLNQAGFQCYAKKYF